MRFTQLPRYSVLSAASMLMCAGLPITALTADALAQSVSTSTTTTTVTTTVTTQPQIVLPNIPRPVFSGRRPIAELVRLTAVEANITIIDQVATTTLELTLHNPSTAPQESVMIVPVPSGVTLRSVQYDGVGAEPNAKLLARDEARKTYNEIVRSMRDPALVEFVGLNLIQTSVFPIPAGGTQKLRLTMEQVLIAEGSRVDYTLVRSNALTSGIAGAESQGPVWKVNIDIQSRAPISTVYSPSHTATITNVTANRSHVTIEGPGTQAGTVRLSYLTTAGDVSKPTFTVFACPRPAAPGETPGGHFMVLGGLPKAANTPPRKREVVIVMDRSGSMRGEKIEQARAAALSVLDGLAQGEIFNVIDYSDSIRSYASQPVVLTPQSLAEAKSYVTSIKPEGGTNIHGALLEALRPAAADNTLAMILFLTDGLPTIGERSEFKIRADAAVANTSHRRMFTFGVGVDVNAPLLSALAETSRGLATTVLPGEDLELSVSRVFRGLAGPVLESPNMMFTSNQVRDVQPATLPDYFDGDQVLILGEYMGSSPVAFTIGGKHAGAPVQYNITVDPATASLRHDYVPRLWATRRIASLIDMIRQSDASNPGQHNNQEVVDEIVRLSTTYGVLTEYTAFLAKEETSLATTAAPSIGTTLRSELERRAVNERSGQGGVNQQKNIETMKEAGSTKYATAPRVSGRPTSTGAPADKAPQTSGETSSAAVAQNRAEQTYYDRSLNRVTVTNVRQMGTQTFYNRAQRWVDARIAAMENQEPQVVIDAGSDAYFALAEELAKTNQQQLLAQDGDLLLLVNSNRVLVRQNLQ